MMGSKFYKLLKDANLVYLIFLLMINILFIYLKKGFDAI
jgi:hypothetical protein